MRKGAKISAAAGLLAFAALAPRLAWAHCRLQYQVIGPGGLFYQVALGSIQNLGVLPGGTTGQLGAEVSWTDIRQLDLTGTIQVSLTATDLTGAVTCPAVSLNLDGPPSCGDDFSPEVFPVCTPSFTVTQTTPHVFNCSSACVSYPQPHTWLANYYLGNAPGPPVASLSPQSAIAGAPSVAVGIRGSGFIGASQVQWNGLPQTTVLVDGTSLLALIPAPLLVSSGTNSVTVLNPGGVSSPLVFTAGSLTPAPSISGLLPTSAMAGGAALALTVNGANFISSSTVLWNGQPRQTLFVNATQLSAEILNADIAVPVTADVAVLTPGSGTSTAVAFTVTAAPSPATGNSTFLFRDSYAFPSPSRRGHPVTIRLQAGLADSVDVHVYDLSGVLVNRGSPGSPQILDDGNGKGLQYTYDYLWDVSSAGSGVYVYTITAKKAGQSDIRKMGKVGVLK